MRGARLLVMRRLATAIVLYLTGCHSCPPVETPRQLRHCQTANRPQDMTDRILGDKKYPKWMKRNYAEWIRYAYDLEEPSSD